MATLTVLDLNLTASGGGNQWLWHCAHSSQCKTCSLVPSCKHYDKFSLISKMYTQSYFLKKGIDKLNNEIFYLDPLGGKRGAKQHIEILRYSVDYYKEFVATCCKKYALAG